MDVSCSRSNKDLGNKHVHASRFSARSRHTSVSGALRAEANPHELRRIFRTLVRRIRAAFLRPLAKLDTDCPAAVWRDVRRTCHRPDCGPSRQVPSPVLPGACEKSGKSDGGEQSTFPAKRKECSRKPAL